MFIMAGSRAVWNDRRGPLSLAPGEVPPWSRRTASVTQFSRAAVLAAAAAALLPLRVGAQALDRLRIVGPPNDGYKAVYYGVESGLFRRYGVTVEPSIVASGAAAAAAVIGDSADLCRTHTLTLIHARDAT
jgi:ABC-type nitrate/sulfonate/bicarbonate transport system substrate-binding protein